MVDATNTADMATDDLLDQIIGIRAEKKRLDDRETTLLDELTRRYDAGEVDGNFSHDDVPFSYSEGRRSWEYPPAIRAIEVNLRAAKKAAEADGSAIEKRGAPFWVIRLPAQ